MGNMIRRSFDEKDHIRRLYLHVLKFKDGTTSLTFAMNAGVEVVSYERLKELHELIGETLKHEDGYNEYKDWHYKSATEENTRALEEMFSKNKKE